jgi:hypothetical protein
MEEVAEDLPFLHDEYGPDGGEGIPVEEWLIFERQTGQTRIAIRNIRLFLESMRAAGEGDHAIQFIKDMTDPEYGLAWCPFTVWNIFKQVIKRAAILYKPELELALKHVFTDDPVCRGEISHMPAKDEIDDPDRELGCEEYAETQLHAVVTVNLKKERDVEILDLTMNNIQKFIDDVPSHLKEMDTFYTWVVQDQINPNLHLKSYASASQHTQNQLEEEIRWSWMAELQNCLTQLRQLFCGDDLRCKLVDQYKLHEMKTLDDMYTVQTILDTTMREMIDTKYSLVLAEYEQMVEELEYECDEDDPECGAM